MAASVTYKAVLDLRRETVLHLAALLHAERQRRGSRTGRRALSPFAQAVMVLRWFIDGTRLAQLAGDNAIGGSTTYRYVHEGIDVLAARGPSLPAALLAAKMAGHSHINLDGTLIHTDRCRVPGPTTGVDLWWSGKHHHHGGNIQVISTPDGWPLWTSEVRPGREHDITCLRSHPEMLPALILWTGEDLPALADLGYEGEAQIFTLPVKRPARTRHTAEHLQLNLLQAHARARAEQANAVLKMTFKALRHVSLDPSTIGRIVTAALVILHIEHGRTT